MGENQSRLQYLFQQYFNDTATPDEVREFWEVYEDADKNDPGHTDIWLMWDQAAVQGRPEKTDWDTTLQRIRQKAADWENKKPGVAIWRPFVRVAAAASIIFILAIGSWLFLHKTKPEMAKAGTQQQRFKNDVPPGSNGAILTLSNGKQIVLDSADQGILAVQGNGKVINQSGQLIYINKGEPSNISNGGAFPELVYNTMSTSRGRQYILSLADGSKVWLNAASSIRYPIGFGEKERRVSITGEAYFEIAKDGSKPFIVTVNGMEIQVLGTHFNVNAYKDEAAITTTLLEGSVKISRNNDAKLLLPGQQARTGGNGAINVMSNVDVDAVVAWKNGFFTFDNTGIESIMRQLSRWYDIDVSYEGGVIPAETFWGGLPRNASLATILKTLERTGVRFGIEGKTVVVLSGR